MSSLLVFLAGWLYANFIEYAWHRWVLHSGHHQVHNAHHRAFFSGEYEARHLLNRWAVLAAALHVLAAYFISLRLSVVAALSLFSYLAVLEAVHAWQHDHLDSRWARWHIEHHRRAKARFNIFLPVWDYLLGSWAENTKAPRSAPRVG